MAVMTTELLAHYDAKIKELIGGKVAQEEGKGLSTNDFTTAEKEKLAALTAVMQIKGTVDSIDNLPSEGVEAGWVYFVKSTEDESQYEEYVYTTDNTWEYIGVVTEVDLSGYVEKTQYATTETAGLVKPDGTVLKTDEAGTLSVNAATADTVGVVKPDGATISADENGAISVVLGTEADIDAMFATTEG